MLSIKKIFIFVGVYVGLRIFSFIFSPSTPLYEAHIINNITTALFFLGTMLLLLKRSDEGWYLIAGEFVLGGSGGYFALYNISLRTLLLFGSISIFLIQQRKNIIGYVKKYQNFICILSLLYIVIIIGALRGYLLDNEISLIIADVIPYLFFLYFFPLQQIITSEQFKTFALELIYSAIIGNFILIIFTFVGFSIHLFVLQDQYYHWYRDVALGKITDAGANFFRVVINEHLLLVPLFIFFFVQKITKKYLNLKHAILNFIPFLCLIILTINLTRIYLLSLTAGILSILRMSNWKRWLLLSITSFLIFIISFVTINLLLSQGKSLGLELLGLRIHSIARPSIEDSALSRVLLLPKIKEKIIEHPLFGNGLGDTITVYSPVFKKEFTTPHFDWGYLEVFSELGLIGFLSWIILIGYSIKMITKIKDDIKNAFLISFITLLIINITSPAIFHVFGIVWIIVISSYSLTKKEPPSSQPIYSTGK